MPPEQQRTSPALHRPRADSSPQGVMSTSPLQGLIQAAMPRFFCFLLPRVHAADVTAGQLASSSPTTSPAPAAVPRSSTLPKNIGRPEFPDTGWERIKDLFDRELVERQRHPEELTSVIKCAVVAALTGFLYGGLPAARFARQRYIQISQAEVYTSRVEAVVSEILIEV
ncbi:hypothetical protein GOODEAATRI_032750 [Goodea atripinnis]|uniref:Complex I assembly factor TIMMDC1, mitochondrial n=1 Tax=Goodea atripinnis TaxID=208336 RepID=A0ABV0P9Q4_9TELE